MEHLKNIDSKIFNIIDLENKRQATDINLIASENYTHPAVLEVAGSALTNKYAEGYPGKRYYSGCEFIDQAEILAVKRCKKLFEVKDLDQSNIHNNIHINVQPHSGSQANMAVYNAILSPGDTIMGMNLSSGGHLTHGHNVNFSGKLYKSVQYNVDPETELIDYLEIEKLANQYKPKLIIAGASAYSRTIDFKKFADIAKSVDAYLMADIAHIAGLIATDLHPNPVPYADFITSTTHKTLRGPRGGIIMCKEEYKTLIDQSIMPGTQGGPFMNVIAAKAVAFHLALQEDFKIYQKQVIANAKVMAKTFQELGYRIVSGGTDNHMFVVDLTSKNITGRDAEKILEKAGINVSRSTIPYDTKKPWITSGIRIGTPAITTRLFKEKDAQNIVYLIDKIITQSRDNKNK